MEHKDELNLGPGELDTDHIPVRRLGPDDLEAEVEAFSRRPASAWKSG